jgi:hypothetical protein
VTGSTRTRRSGSATCPAGVRSIRGNPGTPTSTRSPAGHGREVLDLPNHQHLCRVVGDWFHATDPKISDNNMMRLPGTWNFKPRAYDPHAAPLPVSWAVHPPENRPDATRLRQYLRTRKVGPGGSGTAGPAKAVCGEAESSRQAGPWCWRGGVVGGGWGGLPDPAIRDDANMAQTDPGGVYDAEHAENGRWAWFWTSPGGATFDSAAIYATKEAALYAARAWVKRRYKG